MKRPELTQILLVAAALGGAIALYAPYLSAHWSISPFGDTIYLTGPLFCDISRSVMAGVSPLMNWSTFEALNYNPHVAPYYPFYLFGWLDFCSATAAAQATDIIVIVHVAIFSITMTSLIRATGAGLVASIGGAAIAATLPNTYTISNFPTFIAVAAWLPLATEGLVRLYYHRQFALGALLLAAGTSVMARQGIQHRRSTRPRRLFAPAVHIRCGARFQGGVTQDLRPLGHMPSGLPDQLHSPKRNFVHRFPCWKP